MTSSLAVLLSLVLISAFPLRAESPQKPLGEEAASMDAPSIPDVELVDQNGKTWRLYTDLIKERRVAIDFIFTRCTMICNPLGAVFSRLEKEMKGRSDVKVISVSLDPENDTPESLRSFAAKFQGGSGWTLLTGKREAIEKALQAFGASAAVKEQHGPLVLVGNDKSKQWVRYRGLVSSQRLKESLEAADSQDANLSYFTDAELIDQNGKTRRFYSDLLKGRKVVISFGFVSCKTACPLATKNLVKVQEKLRSKDDVLFIMITVDPAQDTPAALKDYAQQIGLDEDWVLLTGKEDSVAAVSKKLGSFVPNPEQHKTMIFIGDLRSGQWVKAHSMENPDQLANAILKLNEP